MHEPELGTAEQEDRPLPTKPWPGLRIGRQAIHQKMGSEAASSASQMRAARPPKKPRVEKELQTNETMEFITEKQNELKKMRKKLRTREDRYVERNV